MATENLSQSQAMVLVEFPNCGHGLGDSASRERGPETGKYIRSDQILAGWSGWVAENTNFLSNVLPQDLPRPSQHPLQDSPAASTQSTSGFGSKWITWHLVALTSILLGELLEFGTESVEFDSKRAPHLSLVRAVGTSSK
jgi:hypothetical protein